LLNVSRNQLRMTGFLTGHCQLKGYLFKLELVKRPRCDQCKQASGMVSNILHDCKFWPHYDSDAWFVINKTRRLSGQLCRQNTALCSRYGAAECMS
jgi:hypothetical protein